MEETALELEQPDGNRSLMTQDEIRIVVDPTTFRCSTNVTGEVWLYVNERAFPEERWSDFPVIILGWWLQTFSHHRPSSPARMTFMDGPYDWTLKSQGVTASITANRDDVELFAASGVPILAVRGALVGAAELTAAACRANEWITRDLLYLEQQITKSAT